MLPCGSLLLALALAAQAGDGRGSPGMDTVRAALRSEDGKLAGDDTLVRRLTALGPPVAPALFSLVSGAGLEELFTADDGTAWACLPDRAGELALEALGRLPQEPVLACVRAEVAARPLREGSEGRETRVAALRVLGALGSADTLELFLDLLARSGEELELRAVRALATDALVAILRADSRAYAALDRLLEGAALPEQRLACEALAASGRGEAVKGLERLIGRDRELDLLALEGLCRLAEDQPWRMSGDATTRLRAALDHADAGLRAAAARALGRLRDSPSVPALIARLADPAPAVVRAARWALRECSGRNLSSGEEWQRWFEGERAWWQEEGQRRLAALDPADAAGWAPALRELTAHPFVREPVAEALAERLGALGPELRVLACSTLGRLGARTAVPALIELLFESDEDVRAAAWQALRELTGQDLPPEPRLWEEFAFG